MGHCGHRFDQLFFSFLQPPGLVTVGGYVFAVGGKRFSRSELCRYTIGRYNPNTDTFQLVETMSDNRNNSSIVTLHGLMYFIDPCRVHKYNTETSVWTEVAPTMSCRYNATACTLKGKIYVIGMSSDGKKYYILVYLKCQK